jgi:hypothetical protein
MTFGAAQPPPEAMIKAAMVFNFTRVVEWRSGNTNEAGLVLGLVGDDPTAAALRTFEGKAVSNTVMHVRTIHGPAELRQCHLVYFARSYGDSVSEALRAVTDVAVLTVSDLDGFAERGGMIQLARRQNRVRMIVNPSAAEQAGLRISSQLLRMAEIVGRNGEN